MQKYKRPFVFLCTGMSLDGKLSNYKRECADIATEDDRAMLFDARVVADADMIGGNTLRLDDSSLTVKTEARRKKRLRLGKPPELMKVAVIADANKLKTRGDFFDKGEGAKIIFTTTKTSPQKIKEIAVKAKVFVLGENRVDLRKALGILYNLGVKKLLVEGGGELIFSLLKDNLVDEINLKIGNLIIGGRGAVGLVGGSGFDKLTAKKVKFVKIIKRPNSIILKARVDHHK